jgi:Ca2+-binding RTX toxin-like protein
VNGTTGLNLGANELVNTNAITVKGASNLTLYGTAAQFGDSKITATSPNYTGSLTLVPTATTGDLDFSDVTSPSTGIRRVNIPSGYNSTITLNENNTGSFTVGVAATSTLAWAVAQAGSGQSDAVTVSFGSAATGSGAITATSIESLTLAGGTSATGTLTLGAVTLTNGAGTQTVTITNPGNVAFTSAGAQATITADTVTATGVVGTLGTSGVPLVLANTAGVSFTGGAGNTFVTGSSSADVITTGIGNDTILGGDGADRILAGDGTNTITGGAGDDVMTGGSGADTYIFSATTTNGADTITNFTGGTDKLNVAAMAEVAPTAGTLLSSAGAADTTASRKNFLQVFNTDGTAASIVTGNALTLSLADFTATTLTNVAAFIAAKYTGNSSATGTDVGIYVFNHTAAGSTTSYVYQWDNDTTGNVTQAAELTLVGTISRGTTTLVNADFTGTAA